VIVYLPFLLWFALLLFSLLDIDRTPEGAARCMSPSGWLLVVVLVPILGALAWLVAGRPPSEARPAGAHGVAAAAPPDSDVPWVERIPVEQPVEDQRLQQILDRIDREFEEAVHPTGDGSGDPVRRA
jgi:hypothetical protein